MEKIYITKYALTRGIEVFDSSDVTINDDGKGVHPDGFLLNRNDWYWYKEEAVGRAEELRERKIDSLKRTIDDLKNMEF